MRYYSTQRPITPGSFPKPDGNRVLEIHNYDGKTYREEIGRDCWGYIDYENPLSPEQAAIYELTPAKEADARLLHGFQKACKAIIKRGNNDRYKYIRGTPGSREAVECEIYEGRQYITTCVVDVDLLLCGSKTFPCGSGDDLHFTPRQRLEILELVQTERRKITDSYPIKTYEGWQQSGLPTFEDYCSPGQEVDEEVIEQFINSTPPTLLWLSCTQAGEPYSFESDECGACRPTYPTFHRTQEGGWVFDGYCFYKENKNRMPWRSKLEERMEQVRREIENQG